jgi:hypothetical protein
MDEAPFMVLYWEQGIPFVAIRAGSSISGRDAPADRCPIDRQRAAADDVLANLKG